MRIERFEGIEAWQMGRELARKVYAISKVGPFAKDWTLKDQMIRASSSVMHNIAEGFDAGSNAEFVRFLGYSYRSCTEIQRQLYIALDQNSVSSDEFAALYEQASRIRDKIGASIKYLLTTRR